VALMHCRRYAESCSGDTILHSWEVLAKILQSEEAKGIVCDVGMSVILIQSGVGPLRSHNRPVIHKNTSYNCRVVIHDGKIVLIRPKMWMANDGNYVRQTSLILVELELRLHSGSFDILHHGISIANLNSIPSPA
jgi:predicted amidohydrolase